MWTHLERSRRSRPKGSGETEIETDRRIIRDKIALLKTQLKKIDIQMATQRKNPGKMVRVALVGYTNAGKSTLMNFQQIGCLCREQLFATLDTTSGKW
jgi:GTP-binding protein HflX